MAAELPPGYSSEDRRAEPAVSSPQLVITPAPGALQFQAGNLGADGERATIEGEVQLKGFSADDWESLDITFKTVETALSDTVELASSTSVLYSRKDLSMTAIPSALPFSILLTPDIPQAIHTPVSSITHTLTATLHPSRAGSPAYTKTIPIQIRRSTFSTAPVIHTAPRSLVIDRPTSVTIQLPRPIFRSGEMIPIYLTVPPPDRQVLVDSGLQLRNVKADLVRYVKVGPAAAHPKASEAGVGASSFKISQGVNLYDAPVGIWDPRTNSGYPPEKDGSTAIAPPPLDSAPVATGSSSQNPQNGMHETVITRSGAACRFHSNRPVQLRLVLPTTVQSLPDNEDEALPPDVDSAGGSITQSTLLHDVSFCVHVQVAFVDRSSHTSTIAEGTIPIIIVPALAQPLIVAADLEVSYMKKHDKPPTRTSRPLDAEQLQTEPPSFDEPTGVIVEYAQASTSASMDPPPFSAEPGGLPSFLESQAAASEPSTSAGAGHWENLDAENELRFEGEGTMFGFTPEDQYDGLSHSIMVGNRANTPPPAMASSINDTDVTDFARFMQDPQPAGGESAVLLPPPMDDPMDPPPGIDERFPQTQGLVAGGVVAQTNQSSGRAIGGDAVPLPGQAVVSGGPPPYLGAPTGGAPTAPPSYLDSR